MFCGVGKREYGCAKMFALYMQKKLQNPHFVWKKILVEEGRKKKKKEEAGSWKQKTLKYQCFFVFCRRKIGGLCIQYAMGLMARVLLIYRVR